MFKNLHPSLRDAMYVVLLSFVLLIAATVYTIRLTFKQYEPVMDKNYYEVGLNYEKTIESQRLLTKEGYQLVSSWDSTPLLQTGESILSVSVLRAGKLTDASSVVLYLERNATTKNGSEIQFHKQGNEFIANIPKLEPGTWNTRIVANISGKSLSKEGKIAIR